MEAQKILSAVARAERRPPGRIGSALVIRLLRGSGDRRLAQSGPDEFPTFGVMRGVSRTLFRDYIDFLMDRGYLTRAGGEFSVLRTTEREGEVLLRGERVIYSRRKPMGPEVSAWEQIASKTAKRLLPPRNRTPICSPG